MNEELVVMGVELRECPRAFLGEDGERVSEILDAAEWAREKILPCGGGLGDQTAAGMDAIRCAWDVNRAIDEMQKAGKRL